MSFCSSGVRIDYRREFSRILCACTGPGCGCRGPRSSSQPLFHLIQGGFMKLAPSSARNSLPLMGGIVLTLLLGACSFNFGGATIPAPSSGSRQSGMASNTSPASPDTPLPIASEASPAIGSPASPLGLRPMGNGDDQSPASQLMSEGTLGYILDHLFGGANPHITQPYLPQPGYSTTTAGGVPGGLWPGNWWIQGQGGGYNLTHLP